MKYLVLLLSFCITSTSYLYCEENIQSIQLDLSIIEVGEKGIKEYGVEQSVLYSLLAKKFESSGIIVKKDPNLPYFVLQIKSVPVNTTIATFLHGSFFEAATVVPSQRDLWAITWYQSSIITSSAKEYNKSVEAEAENLVNSFILDARQKGILAYSKK